MSFDNAGKKSGLEIWRIEDFEAVPLAEDQYGKFHEGDSYIVLKTVENGGQFSHDLHFWLGEETSQDEYGTAAFKAVELDDTLGGVPVQHREVQEHESDLFESYFKGGIKYLPGGVKSGFTKVDPEAFEKRLFIVEGKARNIKVKQLKAICLSSLNKNDCFILDVGKEILVLMPAKSNPMERFKATQVANSIRDEDHAGDSEVLIFDSGNDSKFFEALGEGSRDDLSEEESEEVGLGDFEPKLFKISDDDFVQVHEGKGMKQDMLESGDCFILDSGTSTGIFAWIGKESSKEERVKVMKDAEAYIEKNRRPKWTRLERVVDGGEKTMFKQFFSSWKDAEDSACAGLGRFYPEDSIAEFDIASLHSANKRRLLAKSAGEAIGFMPDDGKGNKEVFRIEDLELVQLEEEKYGMFFGGDSYVIKYEYDGEFGKSYIIYFWQGAQSSQDEKAASAICAVKMDNDLNGKAVQVRVVQGKEPRHFIKMFAGKMIIYQGGKASGFKNVHDHDTYDVDGTRLFQIRGTCPDDTRATQVDEKASSLNSEDVFVLETPGKTYVWIGSKSDNDELDIAKDIVQIVSPDHELETVQEGSEPDEFWDKLGGKGDYATEAVDLSTPILEPRLFHCIEMKDSSLRPKEIPRFKKTDLNPDDVMMLDSGAEIYLWIGKNAKDEEKDKALELAKEYLKADPTHRDATNTLIFTVKDGEEPKSFTCVFSD